MSQDEGAMLNCAIAALQDHTGETGKIESIRAECATLTQYVQGVENDHLQNIESTCLRSKHRC